MIDGLLMKIWAMPPVGSSIRIDFEHGNTMDVDVIRGYVVRKGRKLAVDIATAETLFITLTAIKRCIGKYRARLFV